MDEEQQKEVGSLKSKTVFIAVAITLGLIIAGQGFYLYQQHSDLEILRSKYSFLQEDYATLQEDYNALEQTYSSLEENYETLESEYGTLESEYARLSSKHEVLVSEHDALKQRHSLLQQDYETLESEFSALNSAYKTLESQLAEADRTISNLRSQMEILRQTAEENNFMFYYASLAEQRYGVDDLEEYLDRWQWSEGSYIGGVFDCSEMSAYIEWKLENEGYHTYIVCGEAPWGEGHHAWLLVETSAGHHMPVEATTYDLVKWDNPYFDNYFEYDHKFETIQDALEYNYEEYDWWES